MESTYPHLKLDVFYFVKTFLCMWQAEMTHTYECKHTSPNSSFLSLSHFFFFHIQHNRQLSQDRQHLHLRAFPSKCTALSDISFQWCCRLSKWLLVNTILAYFVVPHCSTENLVVSHECFFKIETSRGIRMCVRVPVCLHKSYSNPISLFTHSEAKLWAVCLSHQSFYL